MTHTKQNPIVRTSGEQTDWILCSLKDMDELEMFDRQAGHQYVPMDVYIDPGTINEHFHASAIRRRWARIHRTSS